MSLTYMYFSNIVKGKRNVCIKWQRLSQATDKLYNNRFIEYTSPLSHRKYRTNLLYRYAKLTSIQTATNGPFKKNVIFSNPSLQVHLPMQQEYFTSKVIASFPASGESTRFKTMVRYKVCRLPVGFLFRVLWFPLPIKRMSITEILWNEALT
jgi:hypothetical protein